MAAPASRTIAFAVRGPLERGDLQRLSDEACALFARHPGTVMHCDVTGVDARLLSVEALARLELAARRHGCRLRLRNASGELLELLELVGLRDVLPDCG